MILKIVTIKNNYIHSVRDCHDIWSEDFSAVEKIFVLTHRVSFPLSVMSLVELSAIF